MDENAALYMIAARCYGHAVRFINHEKVLVPINKAGWLRNRRFSRDFLPVKNDEPVPIGRVGLQHGSVAQRDLTFPDAGLPHCRINLRKSREDILQYRLGRRIDLGKIKT
jgi:hypothetical protein